MDAAVEKGAGRQHHGTATEANTDLRDHTGHAVAFDDDIVHRLLEQPQVGLVLQPAADGRAVQHPVGLRARGAHRRALAAVEDAELDAGFVGGRRHRAAQRVDLLDQMALADAADRRVAAHLPQRLDVVRQQQRAAAHARRGQRGLGAGMAATDDDHVELPRVEHGVAFVERGRHAQPRGREF